MSLQLSASQLDALAKVEAWLKGPEKIFRLFGSAGSGKSTIAKRIEGMVDTYVYATFTGKAAFVLRTKGCSPVSTIHSLIYKVDEDPKTGKVTYHLNEESMARFVDLVVVDECSQVGPDLGNDLMMLAKKILVLGDPGQLDPLSGEGFFTSEKPDVVLTEVHRQAADNPIIQLATQARLQQPIKYGTYGESRVIRPRELTDTMLMEADQILCGTNTTRHFYNNRIREICGYKQQSEVVPVPGEKLICLKNNRDRGFLNGSMWQVESATESMQDVISVVSPMDTDDMPAKILTPVEYFLGLEQNLDWRIRKSADEFCYGYTITTHKAQGSQWPKVLILDQSSTFRESAHKWLYVALTRAETSLTLVK